MRYIPLKSILKQLYSTAEGNKTLRRLRGAHTKVARLSANKRQAHLKKNGVKKWSPVKQHLIQLLGKKCWYTEVELSGAPLTIDHFRPKSTYWFLALDAENYRIACPYSNSPEYNDDHRKMGGKGERFPLLSRTHAKGKKQLRMETPLILDPCNQDDCKLITFQVDGRPVLHPDFSTDTVAKERVTQSTLILNINHKEFNSKREQLYHFIALNVRLYSKLPTSDSDRDVIYDMLFKCLLPDAPFSMAAKQYLMMFRNHDWVAELLASI